MARFMARNSKWPENIFYGQGGSNKARLEKSGHQMAKLATLSVSASAIVLFSGKCLKLGANIIRQACVITN